MTAGIDTNKANKSGQQFQTKEKTSARAVNILAITVRKNTGRAVELGVKNGRAAITRIAKTALSTVPVVKKLHSFDERFYFE